MKVAISIGFTLITMLASPLTIEEPLRQQMPKIYARKRNYKRKR